MPKYVDEKGKTTWTYVVYAIQLDKDACANPKSPCKGTSCGSTPVYVGQTAITANERFEQHKAGYRASRWVRRHGLYLRRQLARGFGELATKDQALAAEAALGERLRRRGYCVYGAH